MSGWEIILGVILGLIVNEACEISPWLARKLARRAAYLQLRDPDEAAGRAEELSALINDRPGKLLKLLTALGFFCSGITVKCHEELLVAGVQAFAWVAQDPVVGPFAGGLLVPLLMLLRVLLQANAELSGRPPSARAEVLVYTLEAMLLSQKLWKRGSRQRY